jgi:hypothetical protein
MGASVVSGIAVLCTMSGGEKRRCFVGCRVKEKGFTRLYSLRYVVTRWLPEFLGGKPMPCDRSGQAIGCATLHELFPGVPLCVNRLVYLFSATGYSPAMCNTCGCYLHKNSLLISFLSQHKAYMKSARLSIRARPRLDRRQWTADDVQIVAGDRAAMVSGACPWAIVFGLLPEVAMTAVVVRCLSTVCGPSSPVSL